MRVIVLITFLCVCSSLAFCQEPADPGSQEAAEFDIKSLTFKEAVMLLGVIGGALILAQMIRTHVGRAVDWIFDKLFGDDKKKKDE